MDMPNRVVQLIGEIIMGPKLAILLIQITITLALPIMPIVDLIECTIYWFSGKDGKGWTFTVMWINIIKEVGK